MGYIMNLFLTTMFLAASCYGDCEIEFLSENGARKNGTFASENYPDDYSEGLVCTLKFVGLLNERVAIHFTDFRLDGFPNRLPGVHTGCTNDYIDIYTQIEHPEHDILDLPIQGRYCGNDLLELPHLLMSLNRTVIITFKSDRDGNTARGFAGSYRFLDSAPYKMGEPALYGACGWSINSATQPTGQILAPYYPAQYPDNQDCFYLLAGSPGQRVRLEFVDFDIYYGGDHCPYDFLRIHDGDSSASPQIGTYCNKLENLIIYSTGPSLYLRFKTQSGRPLTEYQWGDDPVLMSGFNATYTFSDKFVDLNFVRSGSVHLAGTECDVRVTSHGESFGEIVTPNFPGTAPPNTTCYFYIDGLIDAENLEKVILTFTSFQLPGPMLDRRCSSSNAQVAVYLNGQNPKLDNQDTVFCDSSTVPTNTELVSRNPRLSLRFSTNNLLPNEAAGFQASYKFTIDYAIDGTPATPTQEGDNVCHYIYNSYSVKTGKINSPRYPSSYPNDIECIYELVAMPNEYIMVSFETFEVERVSHSPGQCLGDRVSAESIIMSSDASTKSIIPMGTYCGNAYPGPFVTEWQSERMIIKFKSDSEVALKGFQAKYEFLYSDQRFPCGGNITRGGFGEIVPPNYPLKYQTRTVCDWYIYASTRGAQIKINFEHFDIEGNLDDGCQGAVLRLYTKDEYTVAHEICGQAPAPVDNVISENGFIRIKFISSSKSFGKTGFRIAWTEVMPTTDQAGNTCPWFKCTDGRFCIPDTAVCNGRNECPDNSDEIDCAIILNLTEVISIVSGCVAALLLAVLAVICFCIRKGDRSARRKSSSTDSRKSSPRDPLHDEVEPHDRLSKAPMLPSSESSNSTFNPYDLQRNSTSQYESGHPYSPSHEPLYQPSLSRSRTGKYDSDLYYDPRSSHYEPSTSTNLPTQFPYEPHMSTLSSRSSHTPIHMPAYSTSSTRQTDYKHPPPVDFRALPKSNPYMDSCLTSL